MVGIGFGMYTVPPYSTSGKSKRMGLYPKVGFDFGHLFLAIEYNLVQSSGADNQYEASDHYIGIRIGIFAGGGKLSNK